MVREGGSKYRVRARQIFNFRNLIKRLISFSFEQSNQMKMTTRMLIFSLLLAWLMLSNLVSSQPIYRQQVILEDETTEVITINDGEEPVDILYSFSLKHGLDEDQRSMLQTAICSSVNCIRSKAIVWKTLVVHDGENVGDFVLLEDEEPVDAAHEFVLENNLTIGYRHAILIEACAVVDCLRLEPGKTVQSL